jgi:hypothetical protein
MQQAKQLFWTRLQLLARLALNGGNHPPTSQLDWLISTTAITATCVDSRAYRIGHLARRSPSALRCLLRQAFALLLGKLSRNPMGPV